MDDKKTTDIWNLCEIGKNFNRLQNMYVEGEENYNYYHGRQWEGLKKPKSSSEPIVLNIVKPIIKYKVNIVNQNSYQIVFNPNTYETYEELEALIEKDLVRIIEKNDALLINNQELVVEASKEEVDLKEDNLEIVNDVVLEDSAILPDTYLEDEETDDVEEIDTNGSL